MRSVFSLVKSLNVLLTHVLIACTPEIAPASSPIPPTLGPIFTLLPPGTLYSGTSEGGILLSTNGGASWNPINAGFPATWVWALSIDPVTPTTLYAGTDHGVFQSTNAGENWNPFSFGLPDTSVRALAIGSVTPITLYAGTGDGVFKSKFGNAN